MVVLSDIIELTNIFNIEMGNDSKEGFNLNGWISNIFFV